MWLMRAHIAVAPENDHTTMTYVFCEELTDMAGRNVYATRLIPNNGDILLNINLGERIVSGTYLLVFLPTSLTNYFIL